MDLLKDVAGDVLSQTVIVAVSGHLMQALAAYMQRYRPPEEGTRTQAILHVTVILLSLVMGFMQQWLSGTLNAFDPKPWQDFIVVLMANWGVIFTRQQAPQQLKKMMRKLKGV